VAGAVLPVVMPAEGRLVPEAVVDQVAQAAAVPAPAAEAPADPGRVAAATSKNKTSGRAVGKRGPRSYLY
jgi:hypothetical protein